MESSLNLVMASLSSLDCKMDMDHIFNYLSKALGRTPDPIDLFEIGKALYQQGQYEGAYKVLSLYVRNGGSETPGRHLLGHAYFQTQQPFKALQEIRKCVNHGFDNDWQLAVELAVELDYAAEQERLRKLKDEDTVT